ncbi:MAG: archaeoflavoprotein AfpA [Archaeoglobaceae archaeon]|nr:archaeoflavoprotein AfpA [Archaeoglobaceae archaeon]MDW8118155.1 archaeoflavoprotein AfpA [Archaeoglobaceae archaeon]
MKVAWGITGSGDRLRETVEVMKKIKELYPEVEIRVYLSKAGQQVVLYYKLMEDLKANFKLWTEVNANAPFLAGMLQSGKFEFLLIAPATSNTTAKISLGIGDTLLTNSAIMALKAFIPVYIMPSDYKEGIVETELPDGRKMKLRIRKEDVEHVERLRKMDGVFVLEKPEEIFGVFEKHFAKKS